MRMRRTILGAVAALALGAGCGDDAPPPRALVVITVDTLRADRLGVYGGELDLTPRLDALAATSLRFENAYATASFTLPSVASLMTGLHPEQMGIRDNESGVPASVPRLATVLDDAGWVTGAVVGNFVLRASSGLAAGFDTFDDAFTTTEATRGWPERVAADTTDAALALLDRLDDGDAPLFLWVHYQDPHGPYTPPAGTREAYLQAERSAPDGRRLLPVRDDPIGIGGIPDYQALDGETEAAWYRAGYDAEVHETDAQIGRLLDALGQRALLDNAVVLFASDHGEGLGENDYWFAHGEHLTDPLVRIPLLLSVPGRDGAVRSDVASLVDVVPTLLGAVGLDAPGDVAGRDLLARGADEHDGVAYMATLGGSTTPRIAVTDGTLKYVLTHDGKRWRPRLLERDATGRETRSDRPDLAERAKALHRRLARLQRELSRDVAETRQDLDDAEREALRALGYVGRDEGADGDG